MKITKGKSKSQKTSPSKKKHVFGGTDITWYREKLAASKVLDKGEN